MKCKLCESEMKYIGKRGDGFGSTETWICKTCGVTYEENPGGNDWTDTDGDNLDDYEVDKYYREVKDTIADIDRRWNQVKYRMTITKLRTIRDYIIGLK